MGNSFSHLGIFERDRLESLLDRGCSQTEIAKILGVHKSTVSREIRKRSMETGMYSAGAAELKAGVKRSNSKYQGMKIEQHPWLKKHVIAELKRYRSPDEIAGRMIIEGWKIRISADAIYRWLRSPFGQQYCRYLCTKRYRKKPQSKNPARHTIPDMTSIHAMPPDPGRVAEGDTFLSPKKVSKAAAVLVCFRDTKLLAGDLVKSLRPVHTARVMRKIGKEHHIDALVLDQGIENAEHGTFGMATYFCDKAAPRQKPLAESSIGLSRRWFWPKGTDLSKVSSEEFREKLEILNNKYRKSLRYRSANEAERDRGMMEGN